jgi:hypothetical protein
MDTILGSGNSCSDSVPSFSNAGLYINHAKTIKGVRYETIENACSFDVDRFFAGWLPGDDR